MIIIGGDLYSLSRSKPEQSFFKNFHVDLKLLEKV